MMRYVRMVVVGIALCAILGAAAQSTYAGTIIKLSLGGVSPDIRYDGTSLFTEDDGNAATTGDQDTAVEFLDFLDAVAADILTPPASFTLAGLTPVGPATVFQGSLVLQNFTGGTFSLYDPSNTLLLEGTLANSALTGALGFSTGGLFTTSFGDVTDGTLAPHILPGTLTLSMSFTAVEDSDGNPGFSVTPGVPPGFPPPDSHLGVLNPFTADATVNIEGQQIPEPASCALLAIGIALAMGLVRRKRHGR